MTPSSSKIANSIYQIPLETAIAWTARWREFQQDHKPEPIDNKKAFRVNVQELQDVINNIPGEVTDIRFYFGLDDAMTEHMVLVGVDKENKDLYTYEGQAYTYDFTHPCPSTCDIDSPLFGDQ